jgi:hypothetical protein
VTGGLVGAQRLVEDNPVRAGFANAGAAISNASVRSAITRPVLPRRPRSTSSVLQAPRKPAAASICKLSAESIALALNNAIGIVALFS